MKLVNVSGLWTTGPAPEATPLTAVLEVCGAVLSWTVDDPAQEVRVAFTDPAQADWLWRIVGESGHTVITEALETGDSTTELEVADVGLVPGSLESLRRLALGHWLRRWWPASRRDGIAELDSALLEGEVALLTDAAGDFFGDDGTFDSDVAGLLRPHAVAFDGWARRGDPRVVELVRACTELAEDTGVAFAGSAAVVTEGRRDDYALAAGGGEFGAHRESIATGTGSVNWGAVPHGIFDSAEGTVGWSVEADDAAVNAVVRTELSGPGSPAGIAVRVRSGGIRGAGTLDAAGSATLTLFDGPDSISETVAWNHDWRETAVSVGVDVAEPKQVRDRVRAFARSRLRQPGADAYLAEIVAAESDY